MSKKPSASRIALMLINEHLRRHHGVRSHGSVPSAVSYHQGLHDKRDCDHEHDKLFRQVNDVDMAKKWLREGE